MKTPKDIYLILDNVYDTYNIGGFFRLADAVGAKKIFLCGKTDMPPSSAITKSSVGTCEWVNWQYFKSVVGAISNLKKNIPNINIYAVEQSNKSVAYKNFKAHFPASFIVGSETYGVSKKALILSDKIVEIPMFGKNKSLNVLVACAVIIYGQL